VDAIVFLATPAPGNHHRKRDPFAAPLPLEQPRRDGHVRVRTCCHGDNAHTGYQLCAVNCIGKQGTVHTYIFLLSQCMGMRERTFGGRATYSSVSPPSVCVVASMRTCDSWH
jgi:hypothetical protein